MKIKNIKYIMCAAAALLASCHNDITPTYTVGDADNAIVLRAGISEGGSGVVTRAGSESNHTTPGHKTFATDTKLTLRVDGTWTNKANGQAPHGTISNETVSQTATAAIGAGIKVNSETENTHNKVNFEAGQQLYWDDYGTADPDNSTGRTTGLTIYGAAVNDANESAPTVSNWTALTWSVGNKDTEGYVDQTNGWTAKDLLTSNNVQTVNGDVPYAVDGTYKFNDRASGKLLEFTHAMSKVTVNLTAGEGFLGYETSANDAKFQTEPKVTLLNFNYTGTVDVENKTSTPPTSTTTANIKAWINEGATWASAHTAQATAIVFPGNSFTADIASDGTATSSTNILKVEADGNVYYVTAAQLVKAIAKKEYNNTDPSAGNYTKILQQGVNYILNIKVNKTKIIVEATIKAWDEIDAEETAPVINISANYGQTTATGVGSFDKNYDFFRSLSIASGYDENNTENGINPAARFTYNNGSYTQDKVLYWPNHDTHYFFRGVYPTIETTSTGLTSSTNLAVTTENSKDVIAVENVAYTTDTWPSDLAIALPRTTNTACTNHSKTPLENGICATKGTITMNFEYAMSKVEVRLKSSANTTDPDYVDLTNISVEVVGGYNKGRITLEDGLHDTWVDASDKGDYTLHNTTVVTGFQKTTQDAIIPQVLGDDVKFKITVTNSDGTKDIYYAQLNQIKGKKQGAADDTKAFITEWKHGEYYIYELSVTKSVINVTATLTDWKVVEADEPIWF